MQLFYETEFDGPELLDDYWSAQGVGVDYSFNLGWLYINTSLGTHTRIGSILRQERPLRVQASGQHRFPLINDCDQPRLDYIPGDPVGFPMEELSSLGFSPDRAKVRVEKGGTTCALQYWVLAGNFDIYTLVRRVHGWINVEFVVGWHPAQLRNTDSTYRLQRTDWQTGLGRQFFRIARSGSTITGYTSSDGSSWTVAPVRGEFDTLGYVGSTDTGSPAWPITFVEIRQWPPGAVFGQGRWNYIRHYP
jgi:hypothetical protein